MTSAIAKSTERASAFTNITLRLLAGDTLAIWADAIVPNRAIHRSVSTHRPGRPTSLRDASGLMDQPPRPGASGDRILLDLRFGGIVRRKDCRARRGNVSGNRSHENPAAPYRAGVRPALRPIATYLVRPCNDRLSLSAIFAEPSIHYSYVLALDLRPAAGFAAGRADTVLAAELAPRNSRCASAASR